MRSFITCTHNYNDQVKEYEIGRACNTYGEKRNAYRFLMGKPEGKRSLGRPRRRREENNTRSSGKN
jgi:hypothetical protein